MKHLEELIEIMKKLNIVRDKDEFIEKYTANDPLTDPVNGVIGLSVLYSVDEALREIKKRVYADLDEIHLVASGYEEDTTDLD